MPVDRISQVLVVEDSPTELRLLCDLLRDEGFPVIGCSSAAEALEHVQQQDFGVAVVDLRLPDLSGTQLLQRIRSFDEQIRVIIYTGARSYDSVKEAINLGAFAYVEKLGDPSELLRHVHRACFERVDRYALDLERAVAERTEQLAHNNHELENFTSVVAHDLRSPLLTISGYCQLLLEEFGQNLPTEAGQYLDQIIGGTARMNQLIEDLLEYSRAARVHQELERVDMAAVLTNAQANLEASIREQSAEIEAGPMPTVQGDSTQLVQVLQNLIGNAIKFRRDEPPRIQVHAVRDGDLWRFSVQDNGIGVAQDHFARIFQTFHRLHGQEYPGTGIGLAICKKIIDRHGGRIWLDSIVGQGTTFYFTLSAQDRPAQSL
ncbi:MAG: response regulator [Planctomycetaceae bacterium]|nr:response regulator [Planctomycetaceae bacterium]